MRLLEMAPNGNLFVLTNSKQSHRENFVKNFKKEIVSNNLLTTLTTLSVQYQTGCFHVNIKIIDVISSILLFRVHI